MGVRPVSALLLFLGSLFFYRGSGETGYIGYGKAEGNTFAFFAIPICL